MKKSIYFNPELDSYQAAIQAAPVDHIQFHVLDSSIDSTPSKMISGCSGTVACFGCIATAGGTFGTALTLGTLGCGDGTAPA